MGAVPHQNKKISLIQKIMDLYFEPKPFEKYTRLYETLGVRVFLKAYSKIIGNRISENLLQSLEGLENRGKGGRLYEGIHLLDFIVMLFIMFYVFINQMYISLMIIVGINLIVNVYPIIMQRYLRVRIYNILEKRELKDKLHSAEGTTSAPATEQATTNLPTVEGVTIGITTEPQADKLSPTTTTVTQSLDNVILFDGNEVYEKLGSFYTAYTGKTKGEIFIVVAVDVLQKETLETDLGGIGLDPDSDDLKIEVLKGPAFAMLGKAEELGDFKVIRGTKIDDNYRNLRDIVTSI